MRQSTEFIISIDRVEDAGTTHNIYHNLKISRSSVLEPWGLSLQQVENKLLIAKTPEIDSPAEKQIPLIKKGDQITRISNLYASPTVSKGFVEDILTGAIIDEPVTISLIKELLPWEVKSKYQETQRVSDSMAALIAATYDYTTLRVLTLDTTGHISESDITTLLEETDEKGKPINDSTKHLGIKISQLNRDDPELTNLTNRLFAASCKASQVTSSFLEYTKSTHSIIASIEHNLSSLTPPPKTIDNLRTILAKGAFRALGLTYKTKSIDRNTIVALSSSEVSLGFGIPDIGASIVIKSYRSLMRRLMSTHPSQRASVTVPLFDILYHDGTLQLYQDDEHKRAQIRTRQFFTQTKLLRDNLMTLHLGGTLPRQLLNNTPKRSSFPTQNDEWTFADSTRLSMLANISFIPSPRIGYFLAQAERTESPEKWFGSLDIFALLYESAINNSPEDCMIYVIDLGDAEIHTFDTDDGRKAAGLTSMESNVFHALNQSVQLRHQLHDLQTNDTVLVKTTLSQLAPDIKDLKFEKVSKTKMATWVDVGCTPPHIDSLAGIRMEPTTLN